MLDYELSSQQLAVICALSSGATMTGAAQQAGVHRNTVANWRRNLLPFREALAGAQYDRALFYREKAEELVDLAFQAVRGILTDPKTPPSVRLKAALAIIDTASTPPPPCPQLALDTPEIDLPQPQPELTVHNDAQPAGPTVAVSPLTPAVASSKSAIVHNPAQAPYRRENAKIGRNDACPCGSGQKYKRCCLDKPRVAAA